RTQRVHRAAEQDASRKITHPRSASDMQDADQREQAPRSVAVELDLAGEGLAQEIGAFVVQAAPAHVDGLDLRGRGGLDGMVVTFADLEVIFDDAPEGRQCQDYLAQWI